MAKKYNSETLNDIINELLNSVNESRDKALKVYKTTLDKINAMERELKNIREQMEYLDTKIEKISAMYKKYRERLLQVTKAIVDAPENLQLIYEEAYKKANELLLKKNEMESEYKVLFKKRDELERELKNLKEILIDAENLIQSINTSYKYLNDELSDVGSYLNKKELILLKIIESGEKEKKSIAREIHDGPAQTLAYLTMEVQVLKSLINTNNSKSIFNKTEEIGKHIQMALEEIRQIIYDLRPMALDDLGLLPTLENHIKEFSKNTGINVAFKAIDKYSLANEIPNFLCVTIFRIIQETLNNVYKHSKAITAKVTIEILKNAIKLQIKDDGIGFDVDETLQNIRINGSFGLLGIKERVDLADGEVKIKSKKDVGTIIEVVIPWNFFSEG